MAACIDIRLFGSFQILQSGQVLPPLPTRKCRDLLAYLVVHAGRSLDRAALAGILWGDFPEEKARASLSTALWRLRQALPVSALWLEVDRECLTFRSSPELQVDVLQFDALLRMRQPEDLARAIELYQGDFLEGCYDEWCLMERQRLQAGFLEALEALLAFHQARGEYTQAVGYAGRLLAYDPLREEVHRALMRLYAAAGDRPAALAQYRNCCRILCRELGIEPMPETQALYARLSRLHLQLGNWSERFHAVRTITESYLSELRRTRTYDAAVYVHRPALDKCLEHFLAGSQVALLLVGPSGVGKSCWLAHLAEQRLAAGDLVLFYAASSLTLNLEAQLGRDLCASSMAFVDCLPALLQTAQAQGQHIWLLVDGLNEFQDLGAGPGDLLRRLDYLLPAFTGSENSPSSMKIVLTCRDQAWRWLEITNQVNLRWGYFDGGQPFLVERFTPGELHLAFEVYRSHYRFGQRWEQLSEKQHQALVLPLLLRMLTEISQGKAFFELGVGVALYRHYLESRAPRPDDQLFAQRLASKLCELRRLSLPLVELSADPVLSTGLQGEPDCSYQRLLEAGILVETPAKPRGQSDFGESHLRQVAFAFDRLYEYLLALSVLSRYRLGQVDGDRLPDLAQEAWPYPPLWNAILMVLLITRQPEDYLRLAQSSSFEAHELVCEGLPALYAEDAPLALQIAHRLLDLDLYAAHQVAFRSACEMGEGGYAVFRAGVSAHHEKTRRDALVFFYMLWRRNAPVALHMLDRLVDEISLPAIITAPRYLQAVMRSLSWFTRYDLPPETIDELDRILHKLAVQQLHLPRLASGPVAQIVRRMLALNLSGWPAGNSIARPRAPVVPVEDLERRAYQRVLQTFRSGQAGLADLSLEDLCCLLHSPAIPANILAHHQLSAWLYDQPQTALPVFQQLFETASEQARMTILLAFLPLTMPELQPFSPEALQILETFNLRMARECPAAFLEGLELGFFRQAGPVAFLSLGLRYLRIGKLDFPVLRELLEQARGDSVTTGAYLRLLLPLGWMHPVPVLQMYAAYLDLSQPLAESVLQGLGALWVLHPQRVEGLLLQVGASETQRRRVRQAAPEEQVLRRAPLVSDSDVRVSSVLRAAPYGRWLTDIVFANALEALPPAESARRLGVALFDTLAANDWRIKRLLAIP
ncbi:MAG: BTAD domain-containing putative transcriptional regulator [Chloroflexota bacterium]